MTSYLDTLKKSGDFLTLTRENPHHLEPSEFTLENGTYIRITDTGFLEAVPKHAQGNKQNSKAIVLSAAVHGNETAPIEIVRDMIKDVLSGALSLAHPVLFIFGNPASINIAKRFVEENLNRLFCGTHSKPPGLVNDERKRAKKMEGVIAEFFERHPASSRHHYDLHTAIRDSKNEKFAVYPYLHGAPWQKSELQFLHACGVNTVLMMRAPATTLSYHSSRTHKAHAFTIELGKVKPFGENDMSRFLKADHTLRKLVSEQSPDFGAFNLNNFEVFDVYRTINRTQENFTLHFSDDAPNFTGFAKGALLATDGDDEIHAQVEGEAIVFPNANVAIGQRAILTVIPLDITDNIV